MNKPGIYRIQVAGVITDRWSGWFEDLAIQQVSSGETILTGELRDQAALLGVLSKIHALNLKIVAVQREAG
jgi:hypothetical protein